MIDWATVETRVSKLQHQIYQQSLTGNLNQVHHLQRVLVELMPSKLLAVRRVTQDNQGKNTPGVDGIAKLPPGERYALAHRLKLNSSSSQVRRVYIPKSPSLGKKKIQGRKRRPLGIPTVEDRAKQALAKLALEPQ